VGSGTGISIGEVAERITALLGGGNRVVHDEARFRPQDSEVMELLCDNRKARDLIGWQPQVSLEEGLQATIAFIRQHRDRYKPGTYNI
jgi:dTDP-glucose 4,6-dehydratase